MKGWIKLFGVSAIGAMAIACGNGPSEPEGELAVQGSVSSALGLDNARAVAIGSDGRQFWTYVDRDRDFTLRLPVGQSYRIVIANELGGEQVKIGHLVLRGIDGKTEWLGANEPGTVDVGKLRPARSSTTRTLCSECSSDDDDDKGEADDDKDDHDDDKECHEKGGGGSSKDDDDDDKTDKDDSDDDDCNVCKDDDKDDKELEPSKDPGGKCEDKEKNKGKGGKAGKGDDDKPCTKKNKPSDGGKSEGEGCKQTSECSKVCACVASKCETK